jgi:hypothetical protein
MAIVPDSAWTEVLAFYRELIDEYGWSQSPMLNFAASLAASEYGRVLFPSTSHEALGLSTVATYEERLRVRTVHLVYSETSSRFVVHYHRGRGNHIRVEEVATAEAALPSILAWLGVSSSE